MSSETISWELANRIMALMPEHERGGFCRDCADANPQGICSNREDGMPCDPVEAGVWWAERQANEIDHLRTELAEHDEQEPPAAVPDWIIYSLRIIESSASESGDMLPQSIASTCLKSLRGEGSE